MPEPRPGLGAQWDDAPRTPGICCLSGQTGKQSYNLLMGYFWLSLDIGSLWIDTLGSWDDPSRVLEV